MVDWDLLVEARLAVRLVGVQVSSRVQRLAVEHLASEFAGAGWMMICRRARQTFGICSNLEEPPSDLTVPESLEGWTHGALSETVSPTAERRLGPWQQAMRHEGGESTMLLATNAAMPQADLEVVADLLWRAWRTAETFEALKSESRHDALTGVMNRRGIIEFLKTEERRAQRHERAISVLFVDLDHFKNINDAYGHAAGDEALIAVSKAIRGSLRNIDGVGRYGGDEFLVVLPDTDLTNARRVAERIQKRIKAIKTTPVSVTIGVAASVEPGNLLELADARLMQQKRDGRRGEISDVGMEQKSDADESPELEGAVEGAGTLAPASDHRWTRRSTQ